MKKEVFEELRDEVFRCLFSEVIGNRDESYRQDVLTVTSRLNLLLNFDCYQDYYNYYTNILDSDNVDLDNKFSCNYLVNSDFLNKMKKEVIYCLKSLKKYDSLSVTKMIIILDRFFDPVVYSSNIHVVDNMNDNGFQKKKI